MVQVRHLVITGLLVLPAWLLPVPVTEGRGQTDLKAVDAALFGGDAATARRIDRAVGAALWQASSADLEAGPQPLPGEVHECADLGHRQPGLRRDQVDGDRRRLGVG